MNSKTEFYQKTTLCRVIALTSTRQGNRITRNYFLAVVFICTLLLASGGGYLPGSEQALAQANSPDRLPDTPVRVGSAPDSPSTVRPIDGRFPISVIDSSYAEQNPSVAFNSGFQQTYLVVWDQFVGGGVSVIHGQFVNSKGSLNGGRFPISPAMGYNMNPDVAYNPTDDQYLVVYRVIGVGIYGQIINNAGARVGSEINIVGSLTDTFFYPAVTYSSTSGQYLVTWQRNQGTSKGIEARVVNADGTLSPGAPIAVTGMLSLADSPEDPDVAYDGAIDQCLIVWQQYSGGQRDILGRAIHMTGGAHLASAPFSIFDSTDEETKPAVAALPAPASTGGRYLVVAERLYSGTIYVDGWAVDGDTLIRPYNLAISPYPGKMPAIASNENTQEYLVAWEDTSSTLEGFTISSEGVINPPYGLMSGISVGYPAVAGGPMGDFLVASGDVFASSGYSTDIYGWLWSNRIFMPLVMR